MNHLLLNILSGLLLLLASTICTAADLRSETNDLLVRLRQEGAARQLPDEMRSFDAAVATAELYYQTGATADAERHYRLAAQKGAMIQQQLAAQQKLPPSTQLPAERPQQQDAPTTKESAEAKQDKPGQQETSVTKTPLITDQPTDDAVISDRLVGTVGEYRVAKGETIRIIAAKLGVNRYNLAAMNRLAVTSRLKEGQLLRYNNRRIIPEHQAKDGLIINIPDRMLYYFQKGKLVFFTAVALGTPTKTDQFLWHTPTGKFRIVAKEKDPTWTVPPSIQEEMRLEGKEVITSVPPGPENPLGKYAMKTSLPGILIHSTTKPWSIYTYASHGCIRVYPERMEELFRLIKVNTPGEIIYRPVKLATTETGRIFLEVHGDIYAKTKGITQEATNLLRSSRLSDKVDWQKAKRVISQKSGVAEEITLETDEAKNKEASVSAQSPS